jgi:hypothetical protein
VTYMQTGYAASGNFVSSQKDSNPAPGATPNWTTISWTATVPTNTTLQFQVAASNNATGPFNFVGPDGTTSTYFSNGGSLAQFNGTRYLKYEALFTSSNSTKTPTLNDVTVCFSNTPSAPSTSLTVSSVAGTYGGTVNLSATLTSNSTGVSGKTVSFTLNGTPVGSAVSNGSGAATLSNISLAGINAGTYSSGVVASFAGDSSYLASSGSGNLTVNKANQTITFGPLAYQFYGNPDFAVSATASSGLAVSFAASGQCTVNGNIVHITAVGFCTITASQAGNGNYNAAPNVPQSFNIYAAPAQISQAGWSLLSVDSQETTCGNYAAVNAFDGNPNTFWLTQYCPVSTPMPHKISIDLGAIYAITGFTYLSRQDDSNNGFIAQYAFYVSSDGVNWGSAVSMGSLWQSAADFTTKSTPKQVSFNAVSGRYIQLQALSEALGNPWAAVAELNIIGSLMSSGPTITGLTLNPTKVTGGTTSTATVNLSAAAPMGGQVVQLSSKNTFAATVPNMVTVAAGQTSTTFAVNTWNVASNTSATISATANGSVATAVLNVNTGGAGSPVIPQDAWNVWSVDSQETSCGNYSAQHAFDGNPSTFWLTQYCPVSPALPHDIQIDLGATYQINGFQYLPRQDGSPNGNIGQYQFYISTDGSTWGTPAAAGYLIISNTDFSQKQVTFAAVTGRYVRLHALTEVNGQSWTAAAEIRILGTLVNTGPTVTSLTVNPNSIVGGNSTTATVSLSAVAPSDVVVLLKSNNPYTATVPATVTVPQGQNSTTFAVNSVTVTSNTQVTLSASANGGTSTTTLMVTVVGTTDSLIPQSGWSVLSYDSQETICGSYAATNAIDGNTATFWISQYCPVAPPPPHYLAVDLGGTYAISGFQYFPRQDSANGNISSYKFFISSDGVNWGTAVVQGYLITNPSDFAMKQVTFAPVIGRYVKMEADSEVNGNAWSDIAELGVFGTLQNTGPTVTSLTLNPGSVAGGSTSTATVTISAPAGTGGQVVQLSSKNTFVATVPSTVTVPQGMTTTTFPVSTWTVTANSAVLITADANGGLSSATVTVTTTGTSGSLIPRAGWSILYVDSQETSCGNYAAMNAIDGNTATFWVTRYCPKPPAPMPHDIEMDLGTTYNVGGFQYLPRQDGSPNGNIAQYQFFVSSDGVNWGSSVASGYMMTVSTDASLKQVLFAAVPARYVRLHVISEVNGNPWAGAAEINVISVP